MNTGVLTPMEFSEEGETRQRESQTTVKEAFRESQLSEYAQSLGISHESLGNETVRTYVEMLTDLNSLGLVSLATSTDSNHARARAASERLRTSRALILVPGDIFTETLNILGKKSGHAVALKTAEELFGSDTFVVSDTNEEIRRDALGLFRKQPESVSFAACVVMACADFYGTRDIFGFDETFEKNGYAAPEAPEARAA